MTFYETLTLVMKEKGMTAAALAEKTGLYPSFFSKLKSGHTKDVTWEKAILIINALGITPDDFAKLQSGTQGSDAE